MRRALLLLVTIVAVNVAISSLIGTREPTTVRVPYTPVFLEQLRSGNVVSVDSRGSTLEGGFRRAVAYPAGEVPRQRFKSEVPAYADEGALALVFFMRRGGAVDRAADLVVQSATLVHDNERRWRVFSASGAGCSKPAPDGSGRRPGGRLPASAACSHSSR